MESITKKSRIILAGIMAVLIISIIFFWNNNPSYITYSMIIASLLIYLTVRAEGYKKNDTPEDFFLFNREMPKDEFVPTFVTTNIGLFSSIAFSVILGFYYGIAGMFFTTFAWFFGMYWFSRKIPKLLPFLKTGTTIHEFIANSYGKTNAQKIKLRAWTSAVSAILYFASVGVEIKFGADIFAPSLGEIQSTVLAFLIAFIGLSYTYLSGYKGVVFTDKIQYYILLAGAVIIFIFTFLIGYDNNFSFSNESFNGYFNFPFLILGPDPYGLIGLIVLLSLYQFCIMDMWQRCIAFANTKDADGNLLEDNTLAKLLKKKTFKDAVAPFLIMFIVWFMIGIVALGVNLTTDLTAILPSFLASFDNYGSIGYFAKAIVITGFVAAVMSTVDTFLLSTVQTLMYDIYGTAIVKNLSDKINTIDKFQQYRFVNISKLAIVIIGIAAVGVAFLSFGIMNFWTTMYSIMLSFFPAVYFSINNKSKNFNFNFVFYSVVVGSGGALILGIVGTFIVTESLILSLSPSITINLVSTSPLFAVFSSLLIMKMGEIK
jgi:Na+/proline symporter